MVKTLQMLKKIKKMCNQLSAIMALYSKKIYQFLLM